jgi:hypothetical protein
MKNNLILIILLALGWNCIAQIDTQKRFQSDSRKYYIWNFEKGAYELKETEYENSVIDIREIGSKTNGYITISMIDNGLARLHHGSISNFSQESSNEGTWIFRSKYMKAKITYNPKENTMTYLYDSDDKRYNRLIIFNVAPDPDTENSVKKG